MVIDTETAPAVSAGAGQDVSGVSNDDDKDDSFVYDEFIRRPIEDIAADPRVIYIRNGEWLNNNEEAPRDIGVVVITEEDAHYWDAFAEDGEEEKGWDTEDEDSNGELPLLFFLSLQSFASLLVYWA
jgi:hypothetical protein